MIIRWPVCYCHLKAKSCRWLAICGVLLTLVVVIRQFSQEAVFLRVSIRWTAIAAFKLLFLSAAVLILQWRADMPMVWPAQSEWFSFMLFATLGMMLMASSGTITYISAWN